VLNNAIQPITEILLPDPQPADQNAALVYLASLPAPSGRRTQAQCLRYLAEWMGGTVETVHWSALRYQHTAALRTLVLNRKYSPAAVRKYFAALRGTLKSAWRLGQMTADDYQRAIDLGKVNGEEAEPAGRYVTNDELTAILQACYADSTPAGVRDAAICAMLYFTGLRRTEVINLDLASYDPATGRTKITGKRQKKHIDYVSNEGIEVMRLWLRLRGKQPGPLFLAVNKFGRIRFEAISPKQTQTADPYNNIRMSAQSVYNMVTKRIKQAGLKDISPHDFRRKSASDVLTATHDVLTTTRKYGWSDPKIAQRYDRRPEGEVLEASRTLHILAPSQNQ
jgi:integrase